MILKGTVIVVRSDREFQRQLSKLITIWCTPCSWCLWTASWSSTSTNWARYAHNQGNNARKVNCSCLYSANILKPVLSGQNFYFFSCFHLLSLLDNWPFDLKSEFRCAELRRIDGIVGIGRNLQNWAELWGTEGIVIKLNWNPLGILDYLKMKMF